MKKNIFNLIVLGFALCFVAGCKSNVEIPEGFESITPNNGKPEYELSINKKYRGVEKISEKTTGINGDYFFLSNYNGTANVNILFNEFDENKSKLYTYQVFINNVEQEIEEEKKSVKECNLNFPIKPGDILNINVTVGRYKKSGDPNDYIAWTLDVCGN